MKVRPEKQSDHAAVRELNTAAFKQPDEAEIVDRIRANCEEVLSLVAVEGDDVVGHLFFSPVALLKDESRQQGMGLGPMAVLPGRQRQGVGTALICEGLRILAEGDCRFVAVLGHSSYYPRFGFERASRYNLRSQWDGIPDEAFMVLFLGEPFDGSGGPIHYRAEFDEVL